MAGSQFGLMYSVILTQKRRLDASVDIHYSGASHAILYNVCYYMVP